MNTRYYTHKDIETWERELESVPAEIQSWHDYISPRQKALAELHPQLNDVKEKIRPIDKKIDGLLARIEIIESHIAYQAEEVRIPAHQRQVDNLAPQLENVTRQVRHKETEVHKAKHLVEIKKLQLSIDELDTQIRNEEKKSEELKRRAESATQKSREANTQLEATNTFIASIEKAIEDVKKEAQRQHDGLLGQTQKTVEQFIEEYFAKNFPLATLATLAQSKTKRDQLNQEIRSLDQEKNQAESELRQVNHRIHTKKQEREDDTRKLHEHSYDEQNVARHAHLPSLERSHSERKNERDQLTSERNRLSGELQQQQRIINAITQNMQRLQNKISSLTPTAQEFASNPNLYDLRRQLNEWYAQKAPLTVEKDRLDQMIQSHNESIRRAQQEIVSREKYLQEIRSNQFLFDLRDNPKKLFDELAEKSGSRLQQYDRDFPAHQSLMVRICLAEMKTKLAFIQQVDEIEPGAEDAQQIRDAMRNKYYQLCGLLWNMHQRLGDLADNQRLANEILSYFSPSSVAERDSLLEYHKFQQNHPAGMRDLTENDLYKNELGDYEKESKLLQTALNRIPITQANSLKTFHENGIALVNSVDTTVLSSEETKEHKVDVKFYVKVLNKASALAEGNADADLQHEYDVLVEQEDNGKPSRCKKITGGLGMFFGGAVGVTSGVAKVVSLGLSTTLSTVGIASGSGTCLIGLGLFCNGRRKGMSQTMAAFGDAAKRARAETSPDRYVPIPSASDTNAADPRAQPSPSAPEGEEFTGRLTIRSTY